MARTSSPPRKITTAPVIAIKGARTHNLKSVSCSIPTGEMTVIAGLSGSGKSSLAFDTLFAEGQRRYVESLSTYARQFVARMPRPDVDEIDHIPPAIALEQKNAVRNARSTIGTATEINDYLRLFFARIGRIICPKTGLEVRRASAQDVVKAELKSHRGARVYIVAPLAIEKASLLDPTLAELRRQGFTRVFVGEDLVELDDPQFKPATLGSLIPVVIDRLALTDDERARLAEGVETAYRIAGGKCDIRTRDGEVRRYSQELRCATCDGTCGQQFREPNLQMINFSNPLGACPTCEGFGRVTGLDLGKVFPDPRLTLNEGAIAAFSGETARESLRDLRKAAKMIDVRMDTPWGELTERERRIVIKGEGSWYGVVGFFAYLEERRYKVQARVLIARYRGYTHCPECNGTRMRREALAIRVGGLNLGEVCDMSVEKLVAWFDGLTLTPEELQIVERPLAEIRSRLAYLRDVGLGYLTLSRQTRTLSGGESQRINLSTALGSALTETLYVLDEPTVGLHPRDTERLLGILHHLRDLGNTLVLVEHDLDVVRQASHLIEIGPLAGERGGEIVFEGSLKEARSLATPTLTTGYLFPAEVKKKAKGKSAPGETNRHGRRKPKGFITIEGARENNLRSLTVQIPLGLLCCVSGVSGSGKSTLVKRCLYEFYRRTIKGEASAEPGEVLALRGTEQVGDILLVDQTPLSRSARSNAATYLKAYDHIRTLLSDTPDAQALGLKPRDFSFNVTGGRCETCEGTGRQTVDMHFLSDVEVVCDICDGKRFQDHILQVAWNGQTITTILDLTVDQACEVFSDERKVLEGLKPLQRVGLGYLRLGQSTATLSGGEAQRLKLAAHIAEAGGRGNALLIFDEPTTGLHPADLDVLLAVFQELIAQGFSLLVIEHNLQMLRAADWIIDMGPEGGDGGGMVVVEGPPEEIAICPESITGRFLASQVLGGGST